MESLEPGLSEIPIAELFWGYPLRNGSGHRGWRELLSGVNRVSVVFKGPPDRLTHFAIPREWGIRSFPLPNMQKALELRRLGQPKGSHAKREIPQL
jgi:hypothetical protein